MSSVRMCDRCATIFSENAEGWATQQSTIVKRNEQGRQIQVSAQIDKCPDCVELELMPQRPSQTMLAASPHYEEERTDNESR